MLRTFECENTLYKTKYTLKFYTITFAQNKIKINMCTKLILKINSLNPALK